jgi:hypothetical protein
VSELEKVQPEEWLNPTKDHQARDLMDVVNQIDTIRQALALAGDWQSLTRGLINIREIKKNLDVVISSMEKNVYDLLTDKETFEPGIGMITKSMGSSKKWDSEQLFKDVVNRHMPESGEVTATHLFAILDDLRKVLPLTSSLAWRSGELKRLNFRVEHYCETTYTKPSIRIQLDGGKYEQ